MKKIILIIISIFSLLSNETRATKRALIIAIGNYPNPKINRWSKISGDHDAELIRDALQKQGFLSNNITTLSNAMATTEGIDSALNDLNNQSKAGDVVVIHVSSHGVQVQDDNNDEEDLLDECIVTYNAKYNMATNGVSNEYVRSTTVSKELKNYYRDDLFGKHIEDMRNKLGREGDVLVLLDFCNSGSGTRGWENAIKRGGESAIVFSDFGELKNKVVHGDVIGVNEFREIPSANEKNKATYVVISAVRADEIDFETSDENGKGVGTLTYAVCQTMANLPSQMTYRTFFAAIQSFVLEKKGGNQHPVIEGDGLDRKLWGGDFIEQKPYITIKHINEDHNSIVVNGGAINGMSEGAEVAICPANTQQPDEKSMLCTGIVSTASPINSTIKLNKSISIIKKATEAIVFVTNKKYKINPIVLGFDKNYPVTEAAIIRKSLSDVPLVKFEGIPDLMLVSGIFKDSLFRVSGEAFFSFVGKPSQNVEKLITTIQDYAQYSVIEPLRQYNSEVQVNVKLVPIINDKADTNNISEIIYRKNGSSYWESGYRIPAGMRIKMWIQNDGEKAVYVNVLDLQPNGIINPLLPVHTTTIQIEPQDLRLEPGQGAMFPPGNKQWINITPPYGTERLKIFAMADNGGQPLDLEGIATARGINEKGGASDGIIQKLLRQSYNIRGAGIVSEPNDADISISDCVFEIVK